MCEVDHKIHFPLFDLVLPAMYSSDSTFESPSVGTCIELLGEGISSLITLYIDHKYTGSLEVDINWIQKSAKV